MKRYMKIPEARFVTIPGVGTVQKGKILMGDHFGKFAPQYLVEIPDTPQQVHESHEPQLLTEITPIGEPDGSGAELSEEEKKQGRGRGRPPKSPPQSPPQP